MFRSYLAGLHRSLMNKAIDVSDTEQLCFTKPVVESNKTKKIEESSRDCFYRLVRNDLDDRIELIIKYKKNTIFHVQQKIFDETELKGKKLQNLQVCTGL